MDFKKLLKYSLSDTDLKKILGKDIKIIPYPKLEHVDNINDIFDKKGRVILFFEENNKGNIGHWQCVYKDKNNDIHFFDSYGNKPDGAYLHWLPNKLLDKLDEDDMYLTKLFSKAIQQGQKVYYNPHRYQVMNHDVSDCGRHCATRLNYKHLSGDEYLKMINKSGLSSDDFVTQWSFNILKK